MSGETSNENRNEADNVVNLGDYITGFNTVERNNHYSYPLERTERGSVISFQECLG